MENIFDLFINFVFLICILWFIYHLRIQWDRTQHSTAHTICCNLPKLLYTYGWLEKLLHCTIYSLKKQALYLQGSFSCWGIDGSLISLWLSWSPLGSWWYQSNRIYPAFLALLFRGISMLFDFSRGYWSFWRPLFPNDIVLELTDRSQESSFLLFLPRSQTIWQCVVFPISKDRILILL